MVTEEERERLRLDYLKRKSDPLFIERRKKTTTAWRLRNLKRCALNARKWRLKHPGYTKKLYLKFIEKNRKRSIKWRNDNKERAKKTTSLWLSKNPLKKKMYVRIDAIRSRCTDKKHENYKWYGGRGIKCFLTVKDLERLWKRDKAYKMKKPSIDRINNDGNYELSNCRFIEMIDNYRRRFEK